MKSSAPPLFLLLATVNAFSLGPKPPASLVTTRALSTSRIRSSSITHHPSPLSRSNPLYASKREFLYKKRCAAFFAFLTGWADYLLFIKYRFFATMMTGNSMWMAMALVESRFRDVAFYITVIAAYIGGVATFRRAELEWRENALNVVLAPIVTGFLIGSDLLTMRDAACRWIPAVMLSYAWGIINSVGSEVTGNLIFVVTGAMTRISNMLVDRVSTTAGNTPIPKEGMLMSLSVIFGFILGSGWSVFLNNVAPSLKSFGSFSAIGVIYGIVFLWLDRKQLCSWWLKKNEKLCDIDGDEVTCQ